MWVFVQNLFKEEIWVFGKKLSPGGEGFLGFSQNFGEGFLPPSIWRLFPWENFGRGVFVSLKLSPRKNWVNGRKVHPT